MHLYSQHWYWIRFIVALAGGHLFQAWAFDEPDALSGFLFSFVAFIYEGLFRTIALFCMKNGNLAWKGRPVMLNIYNCILRIVAFGWFFFFLQMTLDDLSNGHNNLPQFGCVFGCLMLFGIVNARAAIIANNKDSGTDTLNAG